MSMGKNKEALEIFKRIYAWNTGLSPETYPVSIIKAIHRIASKNYLISIRPFQY